MEVTIFDIGFRDVVERPMEVTIFPEVQRSVQVIQSFFRFWV